jgi:hypothetical protein
MRTEPQARRWRVNITPISSQIEGGAVTELVMLVLPREAAKELLALGGMELADLPAPTPRDAS